MDFIQKAQAWISPELPKRPNGEEPRSVPQSEKRQRRSGSKSREQPHRHEVTALGFDVWQYREDLENQRRHALKVLTSAREELTNYGKLIEELKTGLQKIRTEFPMSDPRDNSNPRKNA